MLMVKQKTKIEIENIKIMNAKQWEIGFSNDQKGVAPNIDSEDLFKVV